MKLLIDYLKDLFHVNVSDDTEWTLGLLSISVQELHTMKRFYTKILGLSVLQQHNDMLLLGIANGSVPLLKLVKRSSKQAFTSSESNLYSFAFKLPKQKQMGSLVNHLLLEDKVINASSDDGYSEAIYLLDPEGNRVKVYWDKPQAQHKSSDPAYREGTNTQIELDYFLKLGGEPYQAIPQGTIVGQIHLSVTSLEKSESFYTSILPFKTTLDYLFKRKNLVMNHNHYSLSFNEWLADKDFVFPGDQKVQCLTLMAPSIRDMQMLAERLEEANYVYDYKDGDLFFKDPNHIPIQITVRDKA